MPLSENGPRRRLAGALVVIALVLLIGVSLFEWLAYTLRPSLGVWASHTMSVIFSSILATIAPMVDAFRGFLFNPSRNLGHLGVAPPRALIHI